METIEGEWRRDFDRRAQNHKDVELDSITVVGPVREPLGSSLATFQVGESGTGEHLIDAALRSGAGEDYIAALRAFVVEEQEHARLLAVVLTAMNHPLKTSHWSDRLFVLLRRLKSLRTEVLTLLVAELIALRYYSALRDGLDDDGPREVFGRIHADEVRHVEFHAATLPSRLRTFSALTGRGVRLVWNVVVTAASVVVAIDHGRALHAAGLGRVRFITDVWRLRSDLDQRLFDPQFSDRGSDRPPSEQGTGRRPIRQA